MVVGEGGRSSGVLLYLDQSDVIILIVICLKINFRSTGPVQEQMNSV